MKKSTTIFMLSVAALTFSCSNIQTYSSSNLKSSSTPTDVNLNINNPTVVSSSVTSSPETSNVKESGNSGAVSTSDSSLSELSSENELNNKDVLFTYFDKYISLGGEMGFEEWLYEIDYVASSEKQISEIIQIDWCEYRIAYSDATYSAFYIHDFYSPLFYGVDQKLGFQFTKNAEGAEVQYHIGNVSYSNKLLSGDCEEKSYTRTSSTFKNGKLSVYESFKFIDDAYKKETTIAYAYDTGELQRLFSKTSTIYGNSGEVLSVTKDTYLYVKNTDQLACILKYVLVDGDFVLCSKDVFGEDGSCKTYHFKETLINSSKVDSTEYKYDEYGRQIEEVSYTGTDIASKITTKYDEWGNVSERERYVKEGNDLILNKKEIALYDKDGNVLLTKLFGVKTISGKKVFCGIDSRDFSYDESGRIVESNIYSWVSEDTWEIKENSLTEYEGNKSTSIITRYFNSKVDSIRKEITEIDSSGRLLSHTTFAYIANSDSWLKANVENYEYDQSGNLVLTEVYVTDGIGGLTLLKRHAVTYDSNGRCLVDDEFDKTVDPEGLRTGLAGLITETTYNEKGDISSVCSYRYDTPDDRILFSEAIYVYENEGQTATIISKIYIDEYVSQYKDVVRYNELGYVISEEEYKYYESTEIYMPTYSQYFEYEGDVLRSETFESYEYGLHSTTRKYDDNGNLVEKIRDDIIIEEHEYDEDGKELSCYYLEQQSTYDGGPANSDKTIMVYGTNGKLLSEKTISYDAITDLWITQITEYQYDEIGNLVKTIKTRMTAESNWTQE